jgi:hypothetical protein
MRIDPTGLPATFLLALLLLGCEASPAPESGDRNADPGEPVREAEVLREDGFGPIRIGMTRADVSRAYGDTLQARAGSFVECELVQVPGADAAVFMMIAFDTVVRIDVRARSIATRSGLRIGDPAAEVQRRHPGLRIEPHKYTDGHYLVALAPGDTLHRFVFETDVGGRITTVRGGRVPEVHWVEGCA